MKKYNVLSKKKKRNKKLSIENSLTYSKEHIRMNGLIKIVLPLEIKQFTKNTYVTPFEQQK